MLVNFKSILVEEKRLNPLVTRFKVYIAKPQKANGFTFTKSVLDSDNMKITIPSSPVLASFVDCTDGSKLGGHTGDLVKTKSGYKRSPAVQGIGFVCDTEPWWEEYKDEEWLTCYCNIWTTYFDGLQNLSEREIYQSMEVSLETDEEGNKIVTECYLLGLCMLEGISPAFDGSTFEQMSFSKQDYSNQVEKLQKELDSLNKYSDIDFSIPEGIKKFSSNSINENQKLTSVCKSNLDYLSKNDYISPDKVTYIQKYFSKIQDKKTFSLSGEDVILDWCENLLSQMKSIDKYNEGETVKFSNKKEEGDKENMAKFTKTQKEEFSTKFSISAKQMIEMMNDLCKSQTFVTEYGDRCKYWICDFDDAYMYGYDEENGGNIAIPFAVSQENTIVPDFENVRTAKSVSVWVVEESESFADTENDDTYMSAVNAKCSEIEEMCNSKMADMEAKLSESNVKLTETEAKMGEQFAATTSLESALEDEKKISEERQKQIDELSAELKKMSDEAKEKEVNALMSKKEFSVFDENKKTELKKMSEDKSYDEFKTLAYAELGKFASTNLEFDMQSGKFSYMHVQSPTENAKNSADDVYVQTRKKFGKQGN